MSLRKYLLEKNVDGIEDDEEFCKTEYETIRDYCGNNEVTEEDIQEIVSRGYSEWDLYHYFQRTEELLK